MFCDICIHKNGSPIDYHMNLRGPSLNSFIIEKYLQWLQSIQNPEYRYRILPDTWNKLVVPGIGIVPDELKTVRLSEEELLSYHSARYGHFS